MQELIYLGRCYLLGREVRQKAACPLPEHSSEIPRSGSAQGLTCGKSWFYALPRRVCSPLEANTPGYSLGRSCPFPLCWPEFLASGETLLCFTGASTGFPAAPAALVCSF